MHLPALLLPLLAMSAPASAAPPQESAGERDWARQEPEFRFIEASLKRSRSEFFGTGQLRKLERLLESGKVRDAMVPKYQVAVGRMYLKGGDIEEAISLLEEVDANRPKHWDDEAAAFLFALGGAYLRQAETANCVHAHNTESCVFPLEGDAVHLQREPAEKARAAFEELLDHVPDSLDTRWLLNLVAMALDDWPEGVSEEHRIPFRTLADVREEDKVLPRMRDVAPALGVDTFNLCGGVAVEDFDGDGLLDVLTSTYDPGGPLTYYRNAGDGTFEDLSDASRASDQLGGLNLVTADYDADGDPDVLVLRGAWLQNEGEIRNSLLRNDGGVFVDVTREAGMAEPARPTQTAAWGDFDGDGDLDVFVGNESRAEALPPREQAPPDETPKERRKRLRREEEERKGDYPSQLWWNQGAGTFVEGAADAGITGDRFCKGVTAGDYDGDGDLDLYVSNIGGNQLFRNEGDGTFVDVAEAAGVVEPAGRSFATWFFDYDNDGWLDLFVAAYDASLGDLAAEALGLEVQATPPRLYRNQGDGTFRDVATELSLARPFKPMGANFGDLDGDGWLDIYLSTGEPQLSSLMPNVFLRNDAARAFVDETVARGLGHLQKGHGVAFADLDHDGDQDVYHQLGGFYPVDRYYNALFENPGQGNRWLSLELEGTRGLRDPIGARVRVVLSTPGGARELHRAVGSVSSFGGSPRRLELGLGDATAVERVEIRWPGGGDLQVLEDVPLDALLRVRQGETGYERVALEPFSFSTD